MFVQAVCANSGPIIDLPKSSATASPPVKVNPGCAICGVQPLAHEFHQSELRAAQVALQPKSRPTITTPARAAVLANVKTFCTSVPSLRPHVFVQVRSAIKAIAINCWVERLIA